MTVQVAIRLPDELIAEVDRLVEGGAFESRSHAIRSGVEAIVAARRRQDVSQGYREAFARAPETDEELAAATRLAVEAIHDEPWDRWW